MDCRTPGSPVFQCFPEFVQIHVHWIGDAIQPCYPLLSPSPPASSSISVFSSVSPLCQGIGASASVLPVSIQGWFTLGLTGLISLLFLGTLKLSITSFEIINSSALRLLYCSDLFMTCWKNHGFVWTFVGKVVFLLFHMLCRFVISFVIVFLPRSKDLLILWLWSPSALILEPKKIKSVTVSIFPPFICYDVGLDTMIVGF